MIRWLARAIERIPGGRAFKFGLYRWWHAAVVRLAPRSNMTYTLFGRVPHQHRALAGPVVEWLRPAGATEPLRVVVFGCSTGAEPASMAATLAAAHPDLECHFECYDIAPEVVAEAVSGRHPKAEIDLVAARQIPGLVEGVFEDRGDWLVVRPELQRRMTFAVGDLLDPGLVTRIAPADIVVGQNFLFHLTRPQAVTGIRHLARLLKPRGVLFIDGMDLDLRERESAALGLTPLDFAIEAIHHEARFRRGRAWPWRYWGLEPFDSGQPDWRRRYATIFLAGARPE